jgi:DNA-binding winged helix-turn-helix (wHTH) protein/Tol biopolymer transport system component
METPSLATIRFGPFEVRPSTRELFKHGMRVKLPPQAFEVLRLLLERKGELVTRQEFHRVLWQVDTFVDFDQGLNNAIKRIREVLNDSAESPRYIETLPRLGYRFVAEVESAHSEPAGPASTNGQLAAAEPPAMPAAAPAAEIGQAPSAPARRTPVARYRLFAGAVVVALAVAWLFRPPYPRPRVTRTVQLTADGIPKWGPVATDGLRVYFTERLNEHETVAAVPISGGQAVPLKLPFPQAGLYDISPDKADLLVAETPDMQQEAPLWRVPIIGGTPRRLGNISAHDAIWSPDGKKLAYTIAGGVYIANADGSDPHNLLPWRKVNNEWAWRPSWSPDSRRIRFDYYDMDANGSHIWEVNEDGSNPHPLFAADADSPMQAFGGWTPDGAYYIVSSWKDLESSVPPLAANLWAVREKKDLFHRSSSSLEQLTTGPTRYFVHTSSLDGKTIFALSSQKHGELMRYDARTKAFSLYASGLSAEGVAFSPDRSMIAYAKYPTGELWRSRTDGSQPLQLSSRPLFASDPSWSPDGKQIAFAGVLAGQPWHSYLVSADGGAPRLIDKIGEGVSTTWTPDGRSLVFDVDDHDHAIKVLNLQTGDLALIPDSTTLLSSRISPDGRWIVATSLDLKEVLLFDVQTKVWRELARANTILWPQWSRDSRFVYFAVTVPHVQIYRINVNRGKPELVLDLKDLRTTGVLDGWFSLTPEGDILVLHDTGGGTEIYALSWDAP